MSEPRLGYQDDASPIEYFRKAVNVNWTYNDMHGALTVLSALQKKPLGDLPKQVSDIILHADDSVQYLLSLYIQARILDAQPEMKRRRRSDAEEMNKFASFLYKDITTLLHGTNGHRTWNDELDGRPVLTKKMREGIATLDGSWQKIRKEFKEFEQMLRSRYPYSLNAFF